MKQNKLNKIDYLLSFFVATFFFIEALNTSIKHLFLISATLWVQMSKGFMLFLFCFLALTIKHMLRRHGRYFIIFESLYLILYAISFFMGNANTTHLLSSGFQTLGVALPVAFYVISVSDKNILLDVLRKTGYFQSVFLIVTLFSINDESTYNMSASYLLVLPTLIFLYFFFSNKSIVDFLFALANILSILLYGARAPLLGITVYIFVKTIFVTKFSIRRIILYLVVGSFFVLLMIYWDSVLLVLSSFLQSRGIHSRTLNSIIQSKFTDLSGRDVLFKYYWDLALQKPFWGWGVFGGWIGPGSGPHNGMIELILAFGFIGGTAFCLFSIYLFFRGLSESNPELRELSIIISSIVVPIFFVFAEVFTSVFWMIFLILGVYSSRLHSMFRDIYSNSTTLHEPNNT